MKKILFLVPLLMIGHLAFSQKELSADKTDTVEKIFTSIESPAQFPGGMSALTQYLSANIRYPKSARSNNIEGQVVVQFVVCKDGSLCDETVVRSVDSSMDKEVVRVVKAMPKWKPGRQNGQAVKVYYTLPVTFRIPKDKGVQPASELVPVEKKSDVPDAGDYLLKKEQPAVMEGEEKIFTSVEHTPEFPGGMKGLQNFIASNIRYPAEAKDKNIEGRVILQFVVDIDGRIVNIKVLRSPGGGLSEEAIRVVEAMPRWRPGTMGGMPVRVYYTLPITFKLKN